MMKPRPSISILLFLLVAAVNPASAQTGTPGTAPGRPAEPQKVLQYWEWRRLSAALQAAQQAKVQAQLARGREAAQEQIVGTKLLAAQADVVKLTAELARVAEQRKEIERRVEDAAGTDSLLAMARQRYNDRQTDFERERERALKALKTMSVKLNANRPMVEELAKHTASILKKDVKYQGALFRLEIARATYGKQLQVLLAADLAWQENIETAKAIKQELKVANHQVQILSPQKIRASTRRKAADRTLSAAETTITHAISRGVKN